MPLAIRAEVLTRCFGKMTAVDRLDLEVEQGEIFGLVGPDGAGKTTTLRLLCGLLDPTSGRVTVDGHDVRLEIELIKDNIGYMPQRSGLYLDLTVQEKHTGDGFRSSPPRLNSPPSRSRPPRNG